MWERCDQPPETPWESCDGAGVPDLDIRERQPEFATPTHELDGASIERRPDAIALDYWTAHTLGPVREGDTSEGLVAWTWRARTLDGYTVTLTRETETRDGWEPNGAVFTITDGGPPIIELDVAFEQTGNAVVCASRATGPDGGEEVWIYFYDPTVPGYVFRNFGPGRTPRALLDRPLEIASSDVCVFYVADHAGRIAYRQQRDRYEAEILTPADADEHTFIEDVAKGQGRRVYVLYTARDPESGTYSGPYALASTLPPFAVESEELDGSHALILASLVQAIIDAPATAPAEMDALHRLARVTLREPVIIMSAAAAEMEGAHALISAQIMDIVIRRTMAPVEMNAGHVLLSGAVILTITIDQEAEVMEMDAAHLLASVTLEAA